MGNICRILTRNHERKKEREGRKKEGTNKQRMGQWK
jgi:hypothetical protein